jgi:hypothetical protein
VISIEKPGTPEEILEHHGVLGMKWGRRTGGSSSGGKSKPRGRERSRQFAAKYHTGAARSKEIQRARARDAKRFTDFSTERDPTKKAKLKKVYLDHPDRANCSSYDSRRKGSSRDSSWSSGYCAYRSRYWCRTWRSDRLSASRRKVTAKEKIKEALAWFLQVRAVQSV